MLFFEEIKVLCCVVFCLWFLLLSGVFYRQNGEKMGGVKKGKYNTSMPSWVSCMVEACEISLEKST